MPYQAALVMNLHCHPCLLPSRLFNITLFMMISSRFLFDVYLMSSCDNKDFYDTFNTKLPVRNPLSKTGRSQARVNQFWKIRTTSDRSPPGRPDVDFESLESAAQWTRTWVMSWTHCLIEILDPKLILVDLLRNSRHTSQDTWTRNNNCGE